MANDMNFDIKIEDNTLAIIKEKDQAVERALYVIGLKALEGAVDAISGHMDIPSAVDTGRLRASLSFVTPNYSSGQTQQQIPKPPVMVGDEKFNKNLLKDGDLLSGASAKNSVYVGTNVEYAEYVHNGTSRMTGRPFLKVGIENKLDEIKEQVKAIFNGEL